MATVMAINSAIEWTNATWNPVTGCTKVSPGCAHCYAETLAERFRGVPGHPYEQGFDLKLWPERLDLPLKWRQPRLIFVNSMSDLFHPDVPTDFITDIFDIMRRASHHTYQVLTKRPDRAAQLSNRLVWLPNIWLGTSVENQHFVQRVDLLRRTGALTKFISCEPLLGPLSIDLTDINWLIVGGESGSGARPMSEEWVRSIHEQCRRAGVPFFFKQWGAFDCNGRRRSKKATGRLLDGRTWDEMPLRLALG
jgi:protein gp37